MAAYVSKYSWKGGYSYGVSANVVGGVLNAIEKSKGEVTAKEFLEYSRPADSVTHSMFEWDDSVAAEKFRLYQSGRIINQLAIEIVYTEDTTPQEVSINVIDDKPEIESDKPVATQTQIVSAYVNVKPKSVRAAASFVHTIDALKDSQQRAQVLANARGELTSFKRKYSVYKELAAVIREIDNFLEVDAEEWIQTS